MNKEATEGGYRSPLSYSLNGSLLGEKAVIVNAYAEDVVLHRQVVAICKVFPFINRDLQLRGVATPILSNTEGPFVNGLCTKRQRMHMNERIT